MDEVRRFDFLRFGGIDEERFSASDDFARESILHRKTKGVGEGFFEILFRAEIKVAACLVEHQEQPLFRAGGLDGGFHDVREDGF